MVKIYLLVLICYALIDVILSVGVSFSVSFASPLKVKKKDDPPYRRKCEDDIDECFMQMCRRRYDRYRCSRRDRWRQFYRLLFSDLCSYTGRCKKHRWSWYYDDVDVLTCKKDSHCLYDQRCIKGICWDEFQGKRCAFNFDCDDMYICEKRECRLRSKKPQSKPRRFRGFMYFYSDDANTGIKYRENFGYYCRKNWHCNENERCYQQKCMPKRQGKRCRYNEHCDSAYYCFGRECVLRYVKSKRKSTKPPCYSDYQCGNPSLYVCQNRRCIRRKCVFEDDDDCLPNRQGKSCDYTTDCRLGYTCLNFECVLRDSESK